MNGCTFATKISEKDSFAIRASTINFGEGRQVVNNDAEKNAGVVSVAVPESWC